jgi:hypothetical protein
MMVVPLAQLLEASPHQQQAVGMELKWMMMMHEAVATLL